MSSKSNNSFYLHKADSSALAITLDDWAHNYPQGGILALVAESDINAINDLQAQTNITNYPLVGAVFPELVINGKLEKHGILLLRFDVMPSYNIVEISSNSSDSDMTVNNITEELDIVADNSEQSLFMIFDAMISNIASIIDQTYLTVGDTVSYMGVNAGSETFQPINCLFDNHIFTSNSVLVMLIKDHRGASLEHGYTKPEISLSATSTTSNRISSIDWRPAFDVYKELAREFYGVVINEDNFYEHAVHFPFGIMRMDGEMLVRIPVALEADGSIFCVGEVPENSLLTLLKAVSPDSSKTIETIVKQMRQQSENNILSFYCAGRRMHLGDAANNELAMLNDQLDDKNIIGALSLGEIGGSKQGGYPLFHNAALVNIPWK